MDKKTTKRENLAPYQRPVLLVFGDVTELTNTGQSHAGGDAKGGSVMSQGV